MTAGETRGTPQDIGEAFLTLIHRRNFSHNIAVVVWAVHPLQVSHAGYPARLPRQVIDIMLARFC